MGLEGRGTPDSGKWDALSGTGYVPTKDGDYKQARDAGLTVAPLLFETFGGFGPEVMELLKLASRHVRNKLSSAQYDETTCLVCA